MKIKTVLSFLSLVSIIFLSGCASYEPQTGCTSKQAWYQAGISAEQTRRDLAGCQYEALLNEHRYSSQAQTAGESMLWGMMASSVEKQRQNQLIETCMTAKGYSLINTNSPLLTEDQSQPAYVTPEIEAKLAGHWLFIPSPEKEIRGQWDIYFLPNNRYKSISSMVIPDGTPVLKQPSEEKGRYYFTGKSIVLWADNETNHYSPYNFSATDKQLILMVDNIPVTFVKQTLSGKITLLENMTAEQKLRLENTYKAKAESGNAEDQYQLGGGYYNGVFGATNYSEAIKWWQKAADQNYPDIQFPLALAYAGRGMLERNTGDFNEAIADFNRAIENKPDFTELYGVRGNVKQINGDLDGALTDYNKVIEMNPRLALVYSMRGLLNYNLHKFTDALVDFRKSCELNSDAKIQDYSRCYIWFIRARLGEQDSATKELQAYLNNRKTGTSNEWPPNIARLLTGQLTEPDFFKAAENSDQQTNKRQHCEAYFYAGSKRLIEGDKTAATDYFEKCLAMECKEVDEYNSAAAELKSLETSK